MGAKKWEPIKTDSRCISRGTRLGNNSNKLGSCRDSSPGPSTCVIRQGHDYKRRSDCEERATVRSRNESTVQTPSPVSSAAVFGRGVFGARAKKETFAFGEI